MKLHYTLALLLASLLIVACSKQPASHAGHPDESPAEAEKTLYTCGMHPQIIRDKPGDCPICGMKLTPIRKQPGAGGPPPASGGRKIKYYKSTMNPGEISQKPGNDSMGMEMVPVYEVETPSGLSTISIDPVTIQNMGIRTALVEKGPLRRAIRTVGIIEENETALADVTTKFKGWIEKLYVDATGQQVHKGDPLFAIYSPELWSAQREYLLALDQPGFRSSARTKLQYFDISDEQLAELEKTRKATKTLIVKAPQDGFVIEKMAVEGQMVDAGERIYRIADLGIVWVQSQVYEQDLAYIKLGQEALVTLSYLPDSKFRGRVTYVYPTVDEKTRTAKVRMEFHNPGFFLKPGMFATVEIQAELDPSTLLVPDSAVLRSGEKNTAFVALDGGRFDPRTLVLGPRSDNNMYQVRSGLKEGERVVTSGQFMLDSESQLREAIQKMLEPAAAEAASDQSAEHSHASPAPAELKENGTDIFYVCPMPEHVSILHKAPGDCPICRMKLVPVNEATLARLQPEGKVQYYTCPMPEHSDVHEAAPGKCPKCGMTLIPVMETPAGAPESMAKAKDAPATLYTCPMAEHADVVSDKPGKCPKCGMTLVETGAVDHGKEAERHWREKQAADSHAH